MVGDQGDDTFANGLLVGEVLAVGNEARQSVRAIGGAVPVVVHIDGDE